MRFLLMLLLLVTALFLILIILVQRGKGGGLAGAFGGLGGQSAFGTKAGDTFTRVTIGVAAFWIVLCVLTVIKFSNTRSLLNLPGPDNGVIPAELPDTGGAEPASEPSGGGSDSGEGS